MSPTETDPASSAGHPRPASPAPAADAATVTLLDNRATPCAVGLIRAARLMKTLAPGDVLEILSRDRFAPMEVPLWAETDGHVVELKEQVGTWPRVHWRFRIRHGQN
ncbi:MAG: sulfurtransferase TusA family protein [Acidobacteriota bacterium]|nr:sulfurtransferase TusA family protein [Acidobacteriota bacterium]NLH68651.1 sulfurtransferase TusA family protein [Brooklawnia sp.]